MPLPRLSVPSCTLTTQPNIPMSHHAVHIPALASITLLSHLAPGQVLPASGCDPGDMPQTLDAVP
jgi:hypothetical protein